MALNGNTLGTAIATAVGTLTEPQKQNLTTVWQTIANQIVSHFTANAQVAVTVTSVTGVTSGGSASGPGTGTGLLS